MALYMLMAKYSTASLKAIMESGSDREAAARQAVETAGGKLLGFYGMLGQEYGLIPTLPRIAPLSTCQAMPSIWVRWDRRSRVACSNPTRRSRCTRPRML